MKKNMLLQHNAINITIVLISMLAIPVIAQTQAEATIQGVQIYPYVGWGDAVPQEALFFPGGISIEPTSAAQWVPRGGPQIITAAVAGPMQQASTFLPLELLIFGVVVFAFAAVLYINGRRKHAVEPVVVSGG